MHMSDMHCSIIPVWDLCAFQTLTERERATHTHMLVLSDD